MSAWLIFAEGPRLFMYSRATLAVDRVLARLEGVGRGRDGFGLGAVELGVDALAFDRAAMRFSLPLGSAPATPGRRPWLRRGGLDESSFSQTLGPLLLQILAALSTAC